jgi:hypothetical protein
MFSITITNHEKTETKDRNIHTYITHLVASLKMTALNASCQNNLTSFFVGRLSNLFRVSATNA